MGDSEQVYELGRVTADLVVLTVLPEEYAAALACLRERQRLRGTATTPNTCAWQLGEIDARHYGAPFRVVVGMATATTTFGALATRQAIELFDPRYIAFVGVAGGFDRDGQRHGDVAVSSVVTAYEYGKLDTGGFVPRGSFTYRCNDALVRAADAITATREVWWDRANTPAGPPRVRTGMIASGDKVIDDPDEAFFAAVRAAWPQLLAVEMEGIGVAAAVHEVQGQRAIGFILVRGISDMPHRKPPGAPPSTGERDRWKVTASRNAARFLAHLVATAWPVPPRAPTEVPNAERAPGAAGIASGASGGRPAARRDDMPIPAYPNPEVQALSERLERAGARKQALRELGIATDEVDHEILQLRRQLREGGQLRPGDALGDDRYLLIRSVGRGGFAVVWEAWDRWKQQRVAIKVLHPHLSGDSQRKERFFRGARVMMDLKHPAVVQVHDPRGEDDALSYFVMELMFGGNLRDAVLGGHVETGRRLPLLLQVGEALAVAHRNGLVHRDIKPTNILLDRDGNAKLTDFDLVGAHDTTGGTRTGALGTVIYAAPECLDEPQEATPRADVFGLGMTAIFCLSGRDLSMGTFRDPAATVAKLDCPAAVRTVIERAVAWEPERRFPDASSLVELLRTALEGEATDPEIQVNAQLDPEADRGPRVMANLDEISPPRLRELDPPPVGQPGGKPACLVTISGSPLGTRLNLNRPEIVIGRSKKANVRIDENAVSRSHCKILNTGSVIILRDLGSTNGTYVNDEPVDQRVLDDGDVIKIGRCIFKFLSSNDIENSYVEEIYRLTSVDGLTQVSNRRYFVDTLERKIYSARREQRDLSLVMLDVDRFKLVNDVFGHLAGDRVLQRLSSLIVTQLQGEHVLARNGSDEFVIALPGVNRDGAVRLAERIRTLVKDTDFTFHDELIPVTLSVGVASLRSEIEDALDFIKDADAELDKAKEDLDRGLGGGMGKPPEAQ